MKKWIVKINDKNSEIKNLNEKIWDKISAEKNFFRWKTDGEN